MQLIGNAVPPLLAQRIAENLFQGLKTAKPTDSKGALLSFIPTVADGVSPALSHVIDRVNRQFIQSKISTEILEQSTLWD